MASLDEISLAMLTELRADRLTFPNVLSAPPIKDVWHRLERKFDHIDESIARRVLRHLQQRRYVNQWTGANNQILLQISDAGVSVLDPPEVIIRSGTSGTGGTSTYNATIFGEVRQVRGYDENGDLLLVTGERFRIVPLNVEPATFRSHMLRAVCRLTYTGGEWLLDHEPLEKYWQRHSASPRNSESDTLVFSAWMLRDILSENRAKYYDKDYPPTDDLQRKVTGVAWLEERFESYPGSIRDPSEKPLKVEIAGETVEMVTQENPPSNVYSPVFLLSVYKITSQSESISSPGLTPGSDSIPAAEQSGITRRRFRVALSFPGERRQFVAAVATELAKQLGQDKVFYDAFYEAELARPDLDLYMGRIYREQSDLVLPFFSTDYERKRWCKLEWRQMRDILFNLEGHRIMPFRFDDKPIPGTLSIDGYVAIGRRSPSEVAKLILKRLVTNESALSFQPDPSDTGPVIAVGRQMAPEGVSSTAGAEPRPFLEVRGNFVSHDHQRQMTFDLWIRNLGDVVAVSPELRFKEDNFPRPIRSLDRGEERHERIHWDNPLGWKLELNSLLSYSTVDGRKFIDKGKINFCYSPQLKQPPSFTYEQLSRYF